MTNPRTIAANAEAAAELTAALDAHRERQVRRPGGMAPYRKRNPVPFSITTR